jgi:hypothetical protein
MHRLLLALPLLVSACTHDFAAFDPLPGEGDGGGGPDGVAEATPDTGTDRAAEGATDVAAGDSSDAPSDTGPEVDGPCMPNITCISTAMSCVGTCRAAETSCESMCARGDFHCKGACMTTEMNCESGCVSTCTSCTQAAGCDGTTQCQATVGP